MRKEAVAALARTGITCVTVVAILGGRKRQCLRGRGWQGGGARVVLRADQGQWRASSSAQGNLFPKCLGNVVDVGNKRPIVVDGVDVDVDVNVGLVVRCASIVRSLRQTLLVWCEAARVDAPTFMWE